MFGVLRFITDSGFKSVLGVCAVVRVKVSTYVDKDVWERFRRYALRRGIKVSELLEDLMRNEMVEDLLDDALLILAGSESYEVDFEPVEARGGLVSELVRVMRARQGW